MRKSIVYLGLIGVSCLLVAGCSKTKEPSRKELKNMYVQEKMHSVSLAASIEELKQILKMYNPDLAEVSDVGTIYTMPSGEEAYLSINGRIILNKDIDMSASINVPNSTNIRLTENVNYKPGENWTIQIGNSGMEMSHVNGVYSNIKVYNYIGDSDGFASYDKLIKPHLDAIGAKEKKKRTLFAGSQMAGYYVLSTLDIVDDKLFYDGLEESSGGAVESGTAVESESVSTTVESGTVESSVESVEAVESKKGIDETTVVKSGEPSKEESPAVSESSLSAENSAELPEESMTQAPVKNKAIGNINAKRYNYGCGVIISGDTAVIVKFLYKETTNDVTYDEIVNSCISSLSVRGSNISYSD